MKKKLIIAVRKSKLALAQANLVKERLKKLNPIIKTFQTVGDQILDKPLHEIGGKGVFIKSIEKALFEQKADIAVHSMKDMESKNTKGTKIVAVLPREDRRDALISNWDSIQSLPPGATVGTSSIRRTAVLLSIRQDLNIKLLRGNINTRINKFNAGEFDAIILAVAGLKRLNLKIKYNILSHSEMPPAAMQGVLGVQLLNNEDNKKNLFPILKQINCQDTFDCTKAERSVLKELDGTCRTPISVVADLKGLDKIEIKSLLYSPNGKKKFSSMIYGKRKNIKDLSKKVALDLLNKCGGKEFLNGQ